MTADKTEQIYETSGTAKLCTYTYTEKPVYDVIKRIFDIVSSFAAGVILLPVCAVIAICIKAEDGGNVFYFHSRKGRNGSDIRVCKFRSMKPDADKLEKMLTPEQIEEYKKEFKLRNDPRISRIGSFLRKTKLDELPQIYYNVLFKGNMSVVGPRPVMDEETMLYGDNRDVLLSVKPGLTGYWAAYADEDTSYINGTRQKMELHYIEIRSFALDLKIIFRTLKTIMLRSAKTDTDTKEVD